MKNNQQNLIGSFMYMTQVKVVLYAIISATSYYWFLGSTPFEITRGIYGQQINYVHVKLQHTRNRSSMSGNVVIMKRRTG